MGHEYSIIDAFSDVPLNGNPVAVFHDAADLSAEQMQKIGMEMQLSEVTFLGQRSDGVVPIRVFTPVNELPFAGHPLLGSARAYLDRAGINQVVFATKTIKVPMWRVSPSSSPSIIALELPASVLDQFEQEDLVLDALGLTRTASPIVLYNNGPRHLLVHVENREQLDSLRPNHYRLTALKNMAVNCFAVDKGGLVNRMFSPAYGVVEDAGTGSAAGPLAIHAVNIGLFPHGRQIVIEQGHALHKLCRMSVDLESIGTAPTRIVLSGETAIVGSGFITI